MNHSIKFLLQLEPELLKEGSGFRYQLFLKNQSHLEINLFDFTVHDIEIQDITFQETLSPEWILPDFYPLFPQKLSPQETFQMEGELLTYFPLRSKHDYEVKIQIKYYFALTELQEKQGFSSKTLYKRSLRTSALFISLRFLQCGIRIWNVKR